MNISELPAELHFEVFSYLSARQVAQTGRTCRTLYQASEDQSLWKRLCYRDLTIDEIPEETTDFKALYLKGTSITLSWNIRKAMASKQFQIRALGSEREPLSTVRATGRDLRLVVSQKYIAMKPNQMSWECYKSESGRWESAVEFQQLLQDEKVTSIHNPCGDTFFLGNFFGGLDVWEPEVGKLPLIPSLSTTTTTKYVFYTFQGSVFTSFGNKPVNVWGQTVDKHWQRTQTLDVSGTFFERRGTLFITWYESQRLQLGCLVKNSKAEWVIVAKYPCGSRNQIDPLISGGSLFIFSVQSKFNLVVDKQYKEPIFSLEVFNPTLRNYQMLWSMNLPKYSVYAFYNHTKLLPYRRGVLSSNLGGWIEEWQKVDGGWSRCDRFQADQVEVFQMAFEGKKLLTVGREGVFLFEKESDLWEKKYCFCAGQLVRDDCYLDYVRIDSLILFASKNCFSNTIQATRVLSREGGEWVDKGNLPLCYPLHYLKFENMGIVMGDALGRAHVWEVDNYSRP